MIDSALRIWLFMVIVSLSVLGGEVVTYSITGINLTTYDASSGQDVEVAGFIESVMNMAEFNTRSQEITEGSFSENTTYYSRVETFTTAAASVAWNLITLLSGTYIFNFLYLMGIPLYFVTVMVIAYVAILGRAVIGYVRGI